jgi:pyroglutamyl-peptidase
VGSLPVEAIASALQAKGTPAQVSNSAGDYLCNYLYYRSLAHLETLHNPPRAGFLHIPADPDSFDSKVTSAPAFPFEQHLEAVRSALTALSEYP